MTTRRFTPIALCLTWVALLVAFWPSGCAPQLAVSEPARSAQPVSPSALSEPAQSKGTLAHFLPHPAFALAADSDSAQVTIADIAARATPSVVNIASRRTAQAGPQVDPFFHRFFGPGGPPRERKQQGLGSGVIVSDDGLILTNNHVVEGADEITVTTADGKDYDATIVGADEKSDVAVLRLAKKVEGLVPLPYGDSTRLRVGDVVLAIGNPFGVGQTVTMGIVSATGRSEVGIVDYADFIQTDAAINPGNSGGALVNMQGELVGINTAIMSRSGGYQGIGFAIPSNMAESISSSLLQHGRVVRGWLGIGIQDVDADLSTALKLPSSEGVLVNHIEAGGPADRGGLRRGDVILSVDSAATKTSNQLRNVIAAAGANKKVKLQLLRDGKAKTVDLLLGERKSDEPTPPRPESRPDGDQQGLALETLSPKLRRQLDLPQNVSSGVVVKRVDPSSTAAESGLQPGDVVLEVGRKPVNSTAAFERELKAAKGSSVVLLVHRGGRAGGTRYLVLKR